MFIKKILSAFTDDTRIKVYDMNMPYGEELLRYTTVGEFMDSGLMTYAEVDEEKDEEKLFVRDDKIIIWIKTN